MGNWKIVETRQVDEKRSIVRSIGDIHSNKRICLGDYVSDGIASGPVTRLSKDTVTFIWMKGPQATGKPMFNKPDNLVVIAPEVWGKYYKEDDE